MVPLLLLPPHQFSVAEKCWQIRWWIMRKCLHCDHLASYGYTTKLELHSCRCCRWWWCRSDEGRWRWSRSLLFVIFAVIGWVSWPNSKCQSDNDKNRLMWRDNRVRDQREMDRLPPLHRWFCWCCWCRCWSWCFCWCPCWFWCCWCTTGIKHNENFVMQPLLWRCQLQADRRGCSADDIWLILTEF